MMKMNSISSNLPSEFAFPVPVTSSLLWNEDLCLEPYKYGAVCFVFWVFMGARATKRELQTSSVSVLVLLFI